MTLLSGYKVLDFGRYIAGPYCAALLADHGADVIRIEKVSGSEDRFVMPVSESMTDGAMFMQMNRNKRGMTLNPMKPGGREIVQKLVQNADVVVANLPAAGLLAMGLDYDTLKAIKPDIILTTVSTFGSTGPYSERVGFDGLGQVMSGGPHLTGSAETPTRDSLPIVDYGSAMMSAFGTVTALLHRERTGEGQLVEGALLHTALTYASSYLIEQSQTNVNRVATMNRSQIAGPADIVKTTDGWIMVQVIGKPLFERWVAMIGKPELLVDNRFADDEQRGLHGEALSELAQEHASKLTTAQALEAYAAASVPAGPVYTPQQALDDEHINAAGFINSVTTPDGAQVPLITAPIKMSAMAAGETTPAPILGQHTHEILRDIGYSKEQIAAFADARVI